LAILLNSHSSSFKLQKHSKLRDAKAYKFVFSKANKVGDTFFTVLYRENKALHHPRLGVIVAKKNSKKAVERNRIKRLIRESFRLYPDLPKYDIVILSKRATGAQTNKQLYTSLAKLWQKIT
jgi:ribonuclease P protein component